MSRHVCTSGWRSALNEGIWGLGDSSVDSVPASQTRSLEFGPQRPHRKPGRRQCVSRCAAQEADTGDPWDKLAKSAGSGSVRGPASGCEVEGYCQPLAYTRVCVHTCTIKYVRTRTNTYICKASHQNTNAIHSHLYKVSRGGGFLETANLWLLEARQRPRELRFEDEVSIWEVEDAPKEDGAYAQRYLRPRG